MLDFASPRLAGVRAVPDFDARRLVLRRGVLSFDPIRLKVGHSTLSVEPKAHHVERERPYFLQIWCEAEHRRLFFLRPVVKLGHAMTTVAMERHYGGRHLLYFHLFVLDFVPVVLDIPWTMRGIPPGTHPVLDSYDPDREYSLRDLAAVTNVGQAAIGHYVKRGILPRTESRGPYTRYTEEHRIHLLAIAQLRERGYGLAQMAKALDGASLDDIFRIAGYEPPPDEPDVAPAIVAAPAAPPPGAQKAPEPPPAPVEEALGAYRWHSARKRRHWESVAICPGVFLVVLGDADTEARRVAREIEATYGGTK